MITPTKDRNGTYYLRKKIPKDLQALTSRKEIKRSLGTKDQRQAKLLAPIVMLDIDQEIKLISDRALPETRLGTNDIDALCDQWLAAISVAIQRDDTQLANWATESVGLNDSGEVKAYHYWQEELLDNAQYSYDQRKKITAPFIKEISKLNDLIIHEDSSTFRRISYELVKRFLLLKEFAIERLKGNRNFKLELPDVDVHEVRHKTTLLFSELVEKWRKHLLNQNQTNKQKAENQIIDYRKSFERFIAFKSDIEIGEIHRSDIASFRDILYELPSNPNKVIKAMTIQEQVVYAEANNLNRLSNNTVRNAILHLSSLFSFATDSGYIAENIAAGVEPARTKKAHIVDNLNYYTEDDLKIIFSLPVFTKGDRPKQELLGEASYWVPLIMYYTGARREEVCQLHSANCMQDSKTGIHFLRFDESVEGSSVKQGSSARDVPICDALIELGLLDFINSIPKDSRLFPTLKPDSKGKVAAAFGKWWGLYITENTGKSFKGRKPAHAFRHTFETQVRSCGVRQDISDAITGRSNKSSGAGYGGYLEAAKQALDTYPKLQNHENLRSLKNKNRI